MVFPQAFVKIKVLDGPVRGGLSVICWGPEEVTALQVKESDITKIDSVPNRGLLGNLR